MAPSPTGEYHIGHIRTLLYNWAYARKHNGKFILRIEDTDRNRYVKGAENRIMDVIRDYGFDWDEGPSVGGPNEPYFQSKRLDIYHKHATDLVDQGKAYYCFCTSERLAKIRKEQQEKGAPSTKYDGKCKTLSNEEVKESLDKKTPYVIRLKTPKDRDIKFIDLILGEVAINSNELDDQILLKSDGFPTYHLAVVIDDHLMGVTHIMRGSDWVSSTPKHVLLYEAFGWKMPEHAHLPNLKELGGNKKLSKRFGPVTAKEFLESGYLPEALVNFLALLGWSHPDEKEIFSLEQFVGVFDIKDVHKADMVSFDRKKLDWMNGQYLMNKSEDEWVDLVHEFYDGKFKKEVIENIAPLIQTRIKTLGEFEEFAGFFFETPEVDTTLLGENAHDHLSSALTVIKSLEKFELEDLNDALMKEIESKGYKVGNFFMSLRIAITGQKFTPPINESMIILGKDETIKRIKAVLN